MKEEKGQILPLGSVVETKEGEIPLLIVSRGGLFEQDGKVGYFDYVSVPYPGGLTDSNEYAFFNREDVGTVLFVGYRNADEQNFAENYEDIIAKSGYEQHKLPKKNNS
jgi:hypothetical protein